MKVFLEDSVVTCDEIMDAVSKLYVDMTEIVLINSNNKKKRVKWIIINLERFLLVFILLLEIFIICY